MYAYYQPKISVEQEEANIKEMIDKEYEQREQEHIDYYNQIEETYYRYLNDYCKQMEEEYHRYWED